MRVILKPGREKSLYSRHPWVFSGAIASLPQFTDGDILPLYSHKGQHLGFGYFNKKSNITGRMITFEDKDPQMAIKEHILQAIDLRRHLQGTKTNATRLINAEGDLLPGLIVDQYNDVVVIQISTLGMQRQKEFVVGILKEVCKPSWIYEASTSAARKEEGLAECRETLYGTPQDDILIFEDDVQFYVNPLKGQKTGFFQDLREMRSLVGDLSKGKKVLNCFSYTGAFSCHAAKRGAAHVTSVDISKEAIAETTRHMELNKIAPSCHTEQVADCFDFLRDNPLDYDLIILDPPAFAKRKSDVERAVKGYQEINRQTLIKMPKGSLLLTCSCSYHVDEELFLKMLFHASREAKRELRIVQKHRLAFDHPINIYHPESNYLKSFLCSIY